MSSTLKTGAVRNAAKRVCDSIALKMWSVSAPTTEIAVASNIGCKGALNMPKHLKEYLVSALVGRGISSETETSAKPT